MNKILYNSNEYSKYSLYLKAVCSLSKLFSESQIPYLYYRIAENIFCKAFNAENLSRADIAYDAKINQIGFGLKTFIHKKNNFEKIAEFDTDSVELKELKGKNLAIKLSELRNERIYFANRTYGIEQAEYHCIERKENNLLLYNTDYIPIDISNIKNIKTKDTSIKFEDNKNQYSFNFSKSTLYKKFITPQNAFKIDINILDDPLEIIVDLFNREFQEIHSVKFQEDNFIILPLYSLRESSFNDKKVSLKSGLNQWNAGGRKRDYGEVYIPIPTTIHKYFPNFFPDRDTPFSLHLPNGEILNAKLCQENSKALMTNPNNALSDWLLRKVLRLKEGELLTYDRLRILDVDSVKITKYDNLNYKIDFSKVNSYENFIEEFNNNNQTNSNN